MRNLQRLFFFALALTIFASCGQDDEGGISSPIIGSWSFSAIAINEISINGEDLETYLEGEGYSEEEIAEIIASMEGAVTAEFDWSELAIEFSADNTYLVTQPGEENETGTWSLSEDGKVLTVDDEQFDVKTLTSSRLVVGQTNTETTDEGEFSATVELTFTK